MMFGGLHAYTDTRSAGLPWLDTVPAHWSIERAKSVMRTVDIRSEAGTEELLTVSSRRGVVPRSSATVTMFQAKTYAGHKLCWPDDLVINSLWAWGRGLGVAQHHGIVSTAYGVYRAREGNRILPGYLHHLVRSDPFQWELQVRSQGVWKSRLQMTDARWLDAPLVLPPADEQAAIIKYLGHANTRIDKAIAAKRRLTVLLDEQVRAVADELMRMNGAVRVRAKDVCLRIVDCKNRTPDFVEEGDFHVVRTTCIRSGEFSMEGSYSTDSENFRKWTQRGAPQPGDVFFTREAPAGEAALVPDRHDLCLGQRMMYFRPDPERVLSEYLLMAIYAEPARRFIAVATNGSTVGHLRLGDVGAIPLDLPPLRVQEEIVRKNSELTAKIQQTKHRVEREISLLREFRTRLVADVVTGKVDVRGTVASLPGIELSASWYDSDLTDSLDTAEFGDVIEVNEV